MEGTIFDVKIFLCLFLTAMTNRVNEWTTAYYSVYFNDFSLSCKLHQPCIYTSILISTIFAYISLFNNNLLYIDNSTSSVMYSALDLHWVAKSFIIHPPTRDSIQLVFFLLPMENLFIYCVDMLKKIWMNYYFFYVQYPSWFIKFERQPCIHMCYISLILVSLPLSW